jgi:hypothetical protein
MSKLTNKLSKIMSNLIQQKLSETFARAVEEIKIAIISEYDEELVDVVTDRNSKTNPNLYRDDFIERLNRFEYIDVTGEHLSLNVPDMETFDFSGRLRVIESIMEGMAGLHVEVNEEDYKAIFGKRPVNEDPLDDYVPPKERIYLVRYTSKIRRSERELNKKFVRYPFSNTPPIKILEEGERFVEDNMNRWIEEALEEAQKEFARKYRGAKL